MGHPGVLGLVERLHPTHDDEAVMNGAPGVFGVDGEATSHP
jgi:hypothetical protein